ncbi:hypothetical protein [Chryseobacterium camelliae]|uniref:hypothetical protein n=1 Tax=Chryseobacterium camelliae TaxID=1265445 RepID=UPI000C1C918B|nr:hypothetical protein [Chryseobacterium camelliae]
MENNIIKPDKDFEPESKTKKSEHQSTDKEESDKDSIYWQACRYSGPFMSEIDLRFAFVELKNLLIQWLEKRKKPSIYKNETNETI